MVVRPEPIRGLHRFREHFAGFEGSYVLIGGAASLLVMEEAGLLFRATKDLDLVLCVEALEEPFFQAFWNFVHEGGYVVREATDKPRRYYRFNKPTDGRFPDMLELLSRAPEGLKVLSGVHLTPIPTDTDTLSLSAILLEDAYYDWVMQGRRTIDGVPVVGAEHLIPLKVRAHLDLAERRLGGEQIKSSDIKKHQRDVARLASLLTHAPLEGEVPEAIREDMDRFVATFDMSHEVLNQIGAAIEEPAKMLALLRTVYGLRG